MLLKSGKSVGIAIVALLSIRGGGEASCAAAAEAMGNRLVVAQAASPQTPKLFHGVGIVTGVNAKSGLIMINHENIPGLMDAMEMEYQAKPPKLADGLAVGDKVDFTVDGKTLTIVDVKKLPSTK